MTVGSAMEIRFNRNEPWIGWRRDLFSNFHIPFSGLRHLRSNAWVVSSLLDESPRALTMVKRGELLEIRAYAPPGSKPRFVARQFCCCEDPPEECKCIREVVER